MAFKVKVNGIEILCDSPQDAIALVEGLASKKQATKPRGAGAPTAKHNESQNDLAQGMSAGTPEKFNISNEVIKFLRPIQGANDQGIDGDELAGALNLKHPKGLGGRIALIKKKIKEDGYDPDQVFEVKRGTQGDNRRRWFAADKLDEYLDELYDL